MNNRVLLGMSGGVDSSLSAKLLIDAGYEVSGLTFCVTDDAQIFDDALGVCALLGMEHIAIKSKPDFDNTVAAYYINGISCGITPSPCPYCNGAFKFPLLLKQADRMDADRIATGHYAGVREIDDSGTKTKYLVKAGSQVKDQSYMLYRIGQDALDRVIFPLNELLKPEVREAARAAGIKTHAKSDSQGLCFAPEGYRQYLINHMGEHIKRGYFTDKSGKILGMHDGFQLYTIGQRRGLGLTGSTPLFVTTIIPHENRIILGEFKDLYKTEVQITSYIFYGRYNNDQYFGENAPVLNARSRFSSRGSPVRLIRENLENIKVNFINPTAETAPGQHIVFYDGEIVAGGGIIL